MTGPANRRRRQPEDAHHAGKSRSVRKQQTNPARTTWIRFDKVRTFPESFLTPRRNLQNEGRTEADIRMQRQYHKGAFLLVEGRSDLKRFSQIVDPTVCLVVASDGKRNVLEAIE